MEKDMFIYGFGWHKNNETPLAVYGTMIVKYYRSSETSRHLLGVLS